MVLQGESDSDVQTNLKYLIKSMSASRKEVNYALEKRDVHRMLKQFKQN